MTFGTYVCWVTWNERVMVIPLPSLRSILASSVWLKEVTSGAEGARGEDDSTYTNPDILNAVCKKSGVATHTMCWYG